MYRPATEDDYPAIVDLYNDTVARGLNINEDNLEFRIPINVLTLADWAEMYEYQYHVWDDNGVRGYFTLLDNAPEALVRHFSFDGSVKPKAMAIGICRYLSTDYDYIVAGTAGTLPLVLRAIRPLATAAAEEIPLEQNEQGFVCDLRSYREKPVRN